MYIPIYKYIAIGNNGEFGVIFKVIANKSKLRAHSPHPNARMGQRSMITIIYDSIHIYIYTPNRMYNVQYNTFVQIYKIVYTICCFL